MRWKEKEDVSEIYWNTEITETLLEHIKSQGDQKLAKKAKSVLGELYLRQWRQKGSLGLQMDFMKAKMDVGNDWL